MGLTDGNIGLGGSPCFLVMNTSLAARAVGAYISTHSLLVVVVEVVHLSPLVLRTADGLDPCANMDKSRDRYALLKYGVGRKSSSSYTYSICTTRTT